jgi:hypothetical protein
MKRTTFLIAISVLFACLALWHFSTPADASKSSHEPSKAEAAKHNRRDRLKAFESYAENEAARKRYDKFRATSKERAASSKPGAFGRVRNFFQNLFVSGNSKAAQAGTSSEETIGTDADMNSRSGVKMDRKEYLARRGEMIAMLRGLPLPEGVSPDVRAKAIRELEQQQALLREAVKNGQMSPEISGTNWTPIGPAPIPGGQTTGVANPVSGRVLAIAVHPTNANIVYVGTAQGGLYRTLDGGTTWTAIMDSAQSLAIGAIAIDPVTPTTLFVGTGEGNFCGDCFFGVGMYRILNAETTPVLQGPFNTAASNNNAFLANSRSITKIVVSPTNNNILYVGTGSGIGGSGGVPGLSTSNRGLFRCDNAQAATPTFTKLDIDGPPATTNHAVRDIEFEPGNANNLLVALVDTIGFATSGVYRSTNAADAVPANVTFTRTLVSPAAEQAFNIQLAINKTVVGPTTTITVYATLDESAPTCSQANNVFGDFGLVKKSINGGVTWSPALASSCGFAGGQGFYDLAVAVDPNNALNVMLGGSGDYDQFQTPNLRSVDGTNFVKSSTGLHPDTHDIVFAPSNPLIVYHGNDGGIFKSTDGGASWTSLNNTGFNATQFVDLSTHPLDPNYMIGGTQDNGTPFLQASNLWKLGDFGDGGFSIIDQNATDTTTVTAYHTYFNATGSQIGFSRAQTTAEIDPGVTGWPSFFGCGGTANGISCADAVLFYAPMAQGPGSPINTLYFGTTTLYRSADKGPTMPAVSQAMTAPISAIGISLQSDNVRIVGTSNGALFGTSTGANPLVNLDAGNTLPDQFIGRAVIDPNDNTAPYTAYVTLGGFGLAAGAHVYKTTNLADAGTTWTLAGTGIPDVPVNAFAIDPLNSNHLFAGTDIGVYISQNGGASWNPYGAGLPRVAVFDMEFQARSNGSVRVLRIATHGRGIWEITPLAPTAAPASISGQVTTADGQPVAGVTMNLSGARTARAITDSSGNYRFSNVDTDNFYTVTPELTNYHFGPESRSFSLLANKTDAVFTATRDAVIVGNAIDSAGFFVRQHYLDFLGREPDESGFNFWSDQILECGNDAACVERRTVSVSAAYFLSIEFQQTGGLVDGLYRASYGRAPRYAEFMPDTGVMARDVIVGRGGWALQLEANKAAFIDAWVQRADFRAAYEELANNAYVDALISHTGVSFTPSERQALVNGLNSGTASRAEVLRNIVEDQRFVAAKHNETFVMMEYFGYLRRDPDESGYRFWLNKLNQFNGNFEQAEMVKAFLVSGEYRGRF